MEEPVKRELLKSALPLLAIVLMASGIVVKTVPLESKRPADPEHAKFSHAGLQDVEARLWEDPFGAIRHLQGSTPDERCKEALKDRVHHPYRLSAIISRRVGRLAPAPIVLPVLVEGGPYFENAESRRRARYAVVTALLTTGWEPVDEDKLGYVWTFEGCVEEPWARRLPELLPYERFKRFKISEPQEPRFQTLLVLWVEEDALSAFPLRGIERLGKFLGDPKKTLCSPEEGEDNQRQALAKKLKDEDACFQRPEPNPTFAKPRREPSLSDSLTGVPWSDMRVIGPSTSTALQRVLRELAFRPDSDASPPLFYSATATVDLNEKFSEFADPEDLKRRFDERIVRLTATDDKLVNTFIFELELRLRDQTPWQRLLASWKDRPWPCDDTIVIISEGDSSYARSFHRAFDSQASALQPKERCGRDVVEQVSYLRGLDGVLPTGTGPPAPSAPQQTASGGTDVLAKTLGDILPDRATLERADGRSQYDYLRRLGAYLIDLDRRERQGGRRGVTAIGVLGNDTYDKLLVLDALREYFPRAVFFAADLDARLIGREARRSTQNLVVASAYDLKLHRGLQGSAPPFRDTYQTGIYLATLVALDPDAQTLSTVDFKEKWFGKPRLFEIGRTRAVPLSRVETGNAEACNGLNLQSCQNIHPDDEWRGFLYHLPDRWAVLAVAVMALTAAMSALLLSGRARTAVRNAFTTSPKWGVLVLVVGLVLPLVLFAAGWLVIKPDVETGTGEPFAWLEGVSIWPTQIIQISLLILTGALFVLGRMWLDPKIDDVAEKFAIPNRIQFEPSVALVFWTTVFFILFSLALFSLDWPNSPHRGPRSAWFNHILQLLLIVGMTALLVSVLDVSLRAARLLRACLDRYGEVSCQEGLVRKALRERDTAVVHVRRAAEITSAANRLIYLPFLTFLLLVLTRNRVFDAWVLSLPYVALIFLAVGVALLQTTALRRGATKRKTKVLEAIDQRADAYARQAKPAQEGVSNTSVAGSKPPAWDASDLAHFMKSRADQLRGVSDGPFRPFNQEPVVQALLLVLGGTGLLTIVEFLFLGQG